MEAARQSGRGDAPSIEGPAPLLEILATIESAPRQGVVALCLDPSAATPIGRVLRDLDARAEVVVLVGPEGGLSEVELEAAEGAGFARVTLGSIVLRTETVCAAVLGALLAFADILERDSLAPMRFRFTPACVGAAIGVSLLVAAIPARATPTDSEKVRSDFYAKGRREGIARSARSLGRPDLTAAELGGRLHRGRPSRRLRCEAPRLRALFPLLRPGQSGDPIQLVPAVVSALLARGAEVAGAGQAPATTRCAPLSSCASIASSRVRLGEARATRAVRRRSTRRAESSARRAEDYLALPVFDCARLACGPLIVARAEAEIAVIELAAVAPASGDVAAWIGAGPTEREALEKTGVLVLGFADAPPVKTAAVTSMLASVVPATRASSALWIGKPWPRGLSARREALVASVPLAERSASIPLAVVFRGGSFVAGRCAHRGRVRARTRRLGRARRRRRELRRCAHGLARARACRRRRRVPRCRRARRGARLRSDRRHQRRDIGGRLPATTCSFSWSTRRARSRSASCAVGRPEPMEQLALALGVIATGADGKLRETAVLGKNQRERRRRADRGEPHPRKRLRDHALHSRWS